MKKLSLAIITAALTLAVHTSRAQTMADTQKHPKGATGSTGSKGYTGRPMNSASTSQDAGLSTGRSRGGKAGTNSSIGAPRSGQQTSGAQTGASQGSRGMGNTKLKKRKATSNRNTTSVSGTQSKSSRGATGSTGNTGTHITTPPPQR